MIDRFSFIYTAAFSIYNASRGRASNDLSGCSLREVLVWVEDEISVLSDRELTALALNSAGSIF